MATITDGAIINMQIVAQSSVEVKNESQLVFIRIYAPILDDVSGAWKCSYEITDPIGQYKIVSGETSLQSLILTLRAISADIYGSDLYRSGKLGVYGDFGGELPVPATKYFWDIAPFPF